MNVYCLSSIMQVNIIPIIAKSDAISKSELAKFKIKITSELVSNGVQIYQFPTDDETVAEINSTMNVSHFSNKNTAGCQSHTGARERSETGRASWVWYRYS